MGVLILPPMFYVFYKWQTQGMRDDTSIPEEKIPSFLKTMILMLTAALGVSLGLAVVSKFVCDFFTLITGGPQYINGYPFSIVGMAIGLPTFLVPLYFLVIRKGRPGYKFFQKLFLVENSKK